MGIWRVIGSAQLHNLAARSILVLNSTPSGNELVGIHDRMGMKFASTAWQGYWRVGGQVPVVKTG
eukprot:238682-Pelagomonas_calceolata.AAC.1